MALGSELEVNADMVYSPTGQEARRARCARNNRRIVPHTASAPEVEAAEAETHTGLDEEALRAYILERAAKEDDTRLHKEAESSGPDCFPQRRRKPLMDRTAPARSILSLRPLLPRQRRQEQGRPWVNFLNNSTPSVPKFKPF